MSMMVLAAMMMAQAPVATQPQPVPAQQPVSKKQKPKQICELTEVTGSRSKRRVCRDEGGDLDFGPGVHSGTTGAAGSNTSVPGGFN